MSHAFPIFGVRSLFVALRIIGEGAEARRSDQLIFNEQRESLDTDTVPLESLEPKRVRCRDIYDIGIVGRG